MRSVFRCDWAHKLKASRMDGYCGVSLADCEYHKITVHVICNNCNSDGSTDFSIFHIISPNGCNIDVKQTESQDLRSYLTLSSTGTCWGGGGSRGLSTSPKFPFLGFDQHIP
uniref:Uncharacterized protein n=1 Tax=Maylandia zebra TaxID=106582 RepID=A0A3P9BVB9_9CICH